MQPLHFIQTASCASASALLCALRGRSVASAGRLRSRFLSNQSNRPPDLEKKSAHHYQKQAPSLRVPLRAGPPRIEMDFGELRAGGEAPPPPPKPASAAISQDVDRPLPPPPPLPRAVSPTIYADMPGTEPPPFRLSLSPPDAPAIIPSHAAATASPSAATRSSLQPVLRQSPPSPTSPLSLSHSANKPPIIFHAPGSVSPPLAASPPSTSLTADDLEAVELAAMISAAVEVRTRPPCKSISLTVDLHLLHHHTLHNWPLRTRFNAVPRDLTDSLAICAELSVILATHTTCARRCLIPLRSSGLQSRDLGAEKE